MPFRTTRTPDFGRLRKALLCEGEPDRVPNIELGVHPNHKARLIGRPCVTVADEIEFARAAGYDYVKIQPGIDMNPARIGVATLDAMARPAEEGGIRHWAPEHDGIIRTMADIESYVWPRPQDIDYSRIEEACRILPDDMKVIGQYGDIFTFIWATVGFERFCTALVEEPEFIAAMFEKVGAIITNLYENMAQMDKVGALWYSDDLAYTAGLMISPKAFRAHLFPWVRRMGDLARARNIPFLYHTDGLLWDVMEDLVGCGVTSLHPIEPKAMDIAEVKRRMGGRLAVMGNIDVDLLTRATPDRIAAEVKDRMQRVAPGGGYALGSSNSVPDYVRFENYVAMLQAGDEFGRYPIATR